jgi:hypothetical protein
MTTLTQQLEQLKKQQLELEKRIQEDEIRKKRLNNEASIERLEELIKPFTEYLDKEIIIKDDSDVKRNPIFYTNIRKFLKENYSDNDDKEKIYNIQSYRDHINIDEDFTTLKQEEILVTLMGILKKQDKRIKELEQNTLKFK